MQGKMYEDKQIFDSKFNIERNLKKNKDKISLIFPRRRKHVRKKVIRYGGKIDPLTHILKY